MESTFEQELGSWDILATGDNFEKIKGHKCQKTSYHWDAMSNTNKENSLPTRETNVSIWTIIHNPGFYVNEIILWSLTIFQFFSFHIKNTKIIENIILNEHKMINTTTYKRQKC